MALTVELGRLTYSAEGLAQAVNTRPQKVGAVAGHHLLRHFRKFRSQFHAVAGENLQAETSRRGALPNMRVYSRLNCETLA